MVRPLKKSIIYTLGSLLISTQAYADSYPMHTFTVKPISFSILNITTGRLEQATVINYAHLDTFKNAPGFFVGEQEKFGRGYSLEMGYMIYQNFEWIGRFSYLSDEALDVPQWAIRTFDGSDSSYYWRNYGFQFKDRHSLAISTGLNHYFDNFNKWLPFVGGTVGVIFQPSTKADIMYAKTAYAYGPEGNLGEVTLQSAKKRFTAAVQFGVDYRFTKRWAMTMATGIHYLSTPGHSDFVFTDPNQTPVIPGFVAVAGPNTFNVRYKDADRQFTVPFVVSLKMIFE